jgi:riboflavin transporter FmnP
MREGISILSATLAGSVLLQCYFAIWHPSSFGRFAEFPVILLYAACIVAVAFLLLVVPSFIWLRRTQRRVSTPVGFVAGLLLGCLVMLLFMALAHWPVRVPELVAGSIAGAVGVSIYARLIFKRVA